MKKSFTLIVLLGVFSFSAVLGQKGSLLLTFKATDYYSNDTLLLDSVLVENPARDCDTTIYGQPSQMLLTWVTGIGESTKTEGFQVAQNYPNPFTGTTKCNIGLSHEKNIALVLTDVFGKEVAVMEKTLGQGVHTFIIQTAANGIYFLTVRDGTTTKTLKLNSVGRSSNKGFKIHYAGNGNGSEGLKTKVKSQYFIFLPGDVLGFTPYAYGHEASVYGAAPVSDYTAYMVLKPNELDFTADTSSGYAPLLVHFTPSSDMPGIVGWHWDFGDGTTSDLTQPEHIYQTQDTSYSVALTVTTDYNEDITIEKTDYITIYHDLANVNFTADHTFGVAPLTVQFSGYANFSALDWNWDFGDGETVQGVQNPAHTYEEGTYTVSLQVIGTGGIQSEQKTHYIQVYPDVLCPSTVTDGDGNLYGVVQIGEQCWMAENINVGTKINKLDVLGDYQDDNNVVEKYCYDNDIEYCDEYGGLYQWDEAMQYSIEEGARGICPYGWHIPTDEEWKTFETFADNIVPPYEWDLSGWRGNWIGHALKSEGSCWFWDGMDSFGFALLGGGYGTASVYPLFFIGECPDNSYTVAAFWTSTKKLGQEAWARAFTNEYYTQHNQMSYRGTEDRRNNAVSIRCIKDQPEK